MVLEIVKSNMVNNPRLQIISRPKKLGLGTAYIEGFEWFLNSNYEYCVQMDSDFSHSFNDLTRILYEIGKYDSVIGSRYIVGGKPRDGVYIEGYCQNMQTKYRKLY